MKTPRLLPREPPPIDNRIMLRADYELPLYEGESEEEIAARKRVLDAMQFAPPAVTRYFLKGIRTKTSTAATAKPAIIVFTGGQSYAVNGDPVVVTDEEHKILQLFIHFGWAMTRGEIERKAEVTNAPRIIGRLVTAYRGQFSPAIRRPGKKGKGGYLIRIRNGTSQEA